MLDLNSARGQGPTLNKVVVGGGSSLPVKNVDDSSDDSDSESDDDSVKTPAKSGISGKGARITGSMIPSVQRGGVPPRPTGGLPPIGSPSTNQPLSPPTKPQLANSQAQNATADPFASASMPSN
jgi:hypothetical protein